MRIVVALGGNALGYDVKEQKDNALIASRKIAYLIKQGHEVVITHGNGPQVGLINLAFTEKREADDAFPLIGFPECGAMSQGYIGYHLQNALNKVFEEENIKKKAVTIITQVEVDVNDDAFNNPTKPIGRFYSAEEAKLLSKRSNYIMKDMGLKGFRRVVASPKPISIIEKDVITSLIDKGNVVISCGGGGIPVIRKDNSFTGVDAVIDKDYASSLLAKEINADMFIILTNVEQVAINFGMENEEKLFTLNEKEAYKYIEMGYFKEGSMKPKVESALAFTKELDRPSLITSLNTLEDALSKKTGTFIARNVIL